MGGYLKLFLFVSLESQCFLRVPTVLLETAREKRKKSQVPNRMQIYEILNTERVLYPLSYRETHRARENCLVIGENNGKF